MTAKWAVLAVVFFSPVFSQSVPPFGAVLDSSGNEYSIGMSAKPTPGAAQTQPGGGLCYRAANFTEISLDLGGFLAPCFDAEIVKRDSSGNIIFATLLGGSTDDVASAIAIDPAGNIYIAGTTGGSFPVTPNAALATIPAGGCFAAKLTPDGSKFIYATYLPLAARSTVTAIAADGNGNAYITGIGEGAHAFAIKINADGSAFRYNVSFSIAPSEQPTSIAVDANGNAAIAGFTTAAPAPFNAFVAKLDSGGSVTASTTLPSSGSDIPGKVAMDADGNLYVSGATSALDFPTTAGSFQPAPLVPLWSSVPGGFVIKLAPDLSIVYSTYVPTVFGGNFGGVAQLVPGSAGDVYIAGTTGADFPTTSTAAQLCPAKSAETFVAHLDAQGQLAYATFARGVNAVALALDSAGVVLLDSQFQIEAPVVSRPTIPQSSCEPGVIPCRPPIPIPCTSSPLNSATFTGDAVSPGEFVTFTAFNMGPDIGVSAAPDAQGHLPITLGGVQVLFDGQPAELLYVQSRQINVLAPFELAGKTSTSITVHGNATIGPFVSPVVASSQGIFRRQPGVSADAVATNEDGSVNSQANPAPIGSIVSFWGTGFGVAPGCATGSFNVFAANPLAMPWVQITANSSPPSLDYLGGAPTFLCGIEQLNVRIPPDARPGLYAIRASQVDSAIYVK